MSTLSTTIAGYSSKVRIWMAIADPESATGGVRNIAVSHTGKSYVIVREPVVVPPCDAQLVYTIDEQRFEHRVRLVEGISPDRRESAIVFLDNTAGD